MDEIKLKIWKCHPKTARLVPAEKTLNGTAHPQGVKFCRPFSLANSAGWWVFPAVDVDICWRGDNEFEHRLHESFSNAEHELVRGLVKPSDKTDLDGWCPKEGRSKFTWGKVEPSICQFWTGLIFQTPPGWILHIRSPINFDRRPQVSVMEGILESDWMQYDIWLNLRFDRKDEWVEFRKDGWPPIAQIIPMRRESYELDLSLEEEMLNRDTPEANKVFEFWVQYNQRKFCSGGKQLLDPTSGRTKDSTTFHRTRKEVMDGMEPNPEAICPHALPELKQPKVRTKLVKKRST